MKKRGMSAVVTTLIIILLAIVAVGIVWVVVKNIINQGKDEITLTGLTLDLEIMKASYDDDAGILSVTVKRNPGDGNLVGINFVIGDGDNSVVVTRDTTLAELGVKTFTFTLNTLAVGEITSISVAPIFESPSGKEVTGEVRDTTTSTSGDLGTGDLDYGGEPGGGEEPCIPECDGLDCGMDPTGCESCGDCEEGFYCADNQSCVNDTCVPDDDSVTCATAECGTLSNNCGAEVTCGNCTTLHNESWVCSNHVCVYEPACIDTCESEGLECGIHEICGVEYNCEFETGGCVEGYECVPENDTCQIISYINTGLVGWFGPPDVTKYFSSSSLPKTDGLYYGYAATFPGLAVPDCYIIIGYKYSESVYENAIVELNLEGPLSIATEDSYEIWESMGDCLTSL